MGALKSPAIKSPMKVYRKQVEHILRKYPFYKQALRFSLYPSVTMDYSERVQGGEEEYSSSTEKYGIIRAQYSRIVEQVEATLELLTDREREIVECSYFRDVPIPWEVIGYSRGHYFYKKNEILDKMAIAFNLA